MTRKKDSEHGYFFSNWQSFTSLAVAVALFFGSNWLFPLLNGGGTFDAGYLQRPIMAAIWFFCLQAVKWGMLTIDFRWVDNWVDVNGFKKWWDTPCERASYVTGHEPGPTSAQKVKILFAILAWSSVEFLACLYAVPV